jgi:hypothetical protein
MSDQYEVSEEKPDHHFRTETPNIIYELLKEKKLSPLAFVLYSVLKKTAGDYGSCFKTNETLAEECGYSKSTLKTYLKELEEIRLPNDQKLIEVFRRTNPDNSPATNLIKIVDIWRYNGDTFRGMLKSKNDSKDNRGGSPKNLPLGRQKTEGGSPKNPKEEPINKIPIKEAASDAAAFFKCLDKTKLTQADKIQFSKKYTEAQCSQVIDWIATKTNIDNYGGLFNHGLQILAQGGQLDISKPPQERAEDNRSWVIEMIPKAKCPAGIRIEVLNQHVEFGNGVHQPSCVGYEESGFKEKFCEAAKKWKITT